jgi:hypothetical protein
MVPIVRRPFRRSGFGETRFASACLAIFLTGAAAPALAGEPWLEVGDSSLRSDVEILAAHGLIDGPTMTWPLPAGEILARLSDDQAIRQQPAYVQAAAARVLAALDHDGLSASADARLTNQPDTVRGFDAVARNQSDVDAGVEWAGDGLNARLRLGEQSRVDGEQGRFALDGSYVSGRLDNWLIYGGLVDQWYGPGWTSSLILSNNARPFPKIGIMRDDPHAFETPWLSWFGPWQVNLFGGVLDDPRVASDPGYVALRVSVAPLSGLELAATRSLLLCGSGHDCNPAETFFHFNNSDADPNNDTEGVTLEAKYTRAIGTVLLSPYVQFYNRDTGPFVHSYTSHLYGTSAAGPFGDDGSRWRLTAEYADTVPTLNFLGGGNFYGAAYNSYRYPGDGFRYDGRSLGFSLDSDSKLLSIAASVTDTRNWTYRLTYYQAQVSSSQLSNGTASYDPANSFNPVSARPVRINELEAGLTVPIDRVTLSGTLRGQDRQVFPETGATATAELDVSYRF